MIGFDGGGASGASDLHGERAHCWTGASVLKRYHALADTLAMAGFPFDDCPPLTDFGYRRLPWRAPALKAVISLCEQAAERWPEEFPGRSSAFVETGRGLAGAVNGQAHQTGPTGSAQTVAEWQKVALEFCQRVALVAPDWFCHYWRGVVRGGVRPPSEITQVLLGLDFLRPPGIRQPSQG